MSHPSVPDHRSDPDPDLDPGLDLGSLASLHDRPVPVTVVAGRWGTGKSGVVDRLVDALGDDAVVLCDGLLPHDHPGIEVVPVETEVLHATRGCPCCAVRTDLVEAMDDLLARPRRPGHVVIEAVGGSDLALIAQTFLRTPRLASRARVRALVTVVDGHAAGTALHQHPTGALEGLDLDAVAMADLVIVNRLDRLVPALEQQTAWQLWSLTGNGQLHVDHGNHGIPGDGDGTDPLPRRILGLPGLDLRRVPDSLSGCPTERLIDDDADRPLRRVAIDVAGHLDRAALDDWLGELQATAGGHLLRWRARFAVDGIDTSWLGQGVRSSTEVDDGPRFDGPPSTRVDLIGRVPPAAELEAGLVAARAG